MVYNVIQNNSQEVTMDQSVQRLRQWLRENRISQEEAARATGYTANYLNAVLRGVHPLNGNVILKFAETYPDTAPFLLPDRVVKSLVAHETACA